MPGLIRRHENEAGRRLAVFTRIDDRPGGLAALLSVFAAILIFAARLGILTTLAICAGASLTLSALL